MHIPPPFMAVLDRIEEFEICNLLLTLDKPPPIPAVLFEIVNELNSTTTEQLMYRPPPDPDPGTELVETIRFPKNE